MTCSDDNLVRRVAQAILNELSRQDYGDDGEVLGDDLKVRYLDQGEVDLGLVAKVALKEADDALARLRAERDEWRAKATYWKSCAEKVEIIAETRAEAVEAERDKLAARLEELTRERDEALAEADKHAEKIEALLEPYISWEGRPSMFVAKLTDEMNRHLVGIENRTAHEVFDIMRDRALGFARAFLQSQGGEDAR